MSIKVVGSILYRETFFFKQTATFVGGDNAETPAPCAVF